MKCEYCGRVLKPGEYSCPGCGASVENPEPAYNNVNTQGINSGAKIEVKVGGVNISIDGATGNVGTQTPPPVRPTPPPPVRQSPPPVSPTYAQPETDPCSKCAPPTSTIWWLFCTFVSSVD